MHVSTHTHRQTETEREVDDTAKNLIKIHKEELVRSRCQYWLAELP